MTDELFFDTDCLSAFLWINGTNILHELYGRNTEKRADNRRRWKHHLE